MVPTDDGRHILATYGEVVEVVRKDKAETLPPHWAIDHAIDLQSVYILPYMSIYNVSSSN
jgi:hypothetical protein